MRPCSWFLVIGLWIVPFCSSRGQTVQLPTFRVFTVGTTVSVPDRGSALLGGVHQARSARVSRSVPILGRIPGAGPAFGSRGVASSMNSGSVTVSATVIDLDQWDREILGRAAVQDTFEGQDAVVRRRAEFIASHVERLSKADRAPSPDGTGVDQIRRQAQQLHERQQQEALQLFRRGQQALASGKPGIAQIYLKMAQRRADGDLQRRVLANMAIASADKAKPKR